VGTAIADPPSVNRAPAEAEAEPFEPFGVFEGFGVVELFGVWVVVGRLWVVGGSRPLCGSRYLTVSPAGRCAPVRRFLAGVVSVVCAPGVVPVRPPLVPPLVPALGGLPADVGPLPPPRTAGGPRSPRRSEPPRVGSGVVGPTPAWAAPTPDTIDVTEGMDASDVSDAMDAVDVLDSGCGDTAADISGWGVELGEGRSSAFSARGEGGGAPAWFGEPVRGECPDGPAAPA
jgi:hypothetical protein